MSTEPLGCGEVGVPLLLAGVLGEEAACGSAADGGSETTKSQPPGLGLADPRQC